MPLDQATGTQAKPLPFSDCQHSAVNTRSASSPSADQPPPSPGLSCRGSIRDDRCHSRDSAKFQRLCRRRPVPIRAGVRLWEQIGREIGVCNPSLLFYFPIFNCGVVQNLFYPYQLRPFTMEFNWRLINLSSQTQLQHIFLVILFEVGERHMPHIHITREDMFWAMDIPLTYMSYALNYGFAENP
ncbi:hypothetical protein AAHA92_29089 [Salvia divinorum]|uniref:Uncharacterized protein n=1 Tax=Salvia divinorum TaxID=28513 RepID=A0ABD1FX76_SALDI